MFDSPTVVMLIVVTFISSLVHLYSISYMSEDPHSPRFMCYLSISTFFMPMLVTGDNSLQLFLGWEGVGLASYLLIHFWFTRLQADKAAIKAMLVNRVGSFPRNCEFFESLPKSRLEDHACASTFSEASNSLIFCNTRLNEAPPRQERMERSGGVARVRRRERSLGKRTFIEKRGISYVPILEKRASVLSFAEVVKKRKDPLVPLRC